MSCKFIKYKSSIVILFLILLSICNAEKQIVIKSKIFKQTLKSDYQILRAKYEKDGFITGILASGEFGNDLSIFYYDPKKKELEVTKLNHENEPVFNRPIRRPLPAYIYKDKKFTVLFQEACNEISTLGQAAFSPMIYHIEYQTVMERKTFGAILCEGEFDQVLANDDYKDFIVYQHKNNCFIIDQEQIIGSFLVKNGKILKITSQKNIVGIQKDNANKFWRYEDGTLERFSINFPELEKNNSQSLLSFEQHLLNINDSGTVLLFSLGYDPLQGGKNYLFRYFIKDQSWEMVEGLFHSVDKSRIFIDQFIIVKKWLYETGNQHSKKSICQINLDATDQNEIYQKITDLPFDLQGFCAFRAISEPIANIPTILYNVPNQKSMVLIGNKEWQNAAEFLKKRKFKSKKMLQNLKIGITQKPDDSYYQSNLSHDGKYPAMIWGTTFNKYYTEKWSPKNHDLTAFIFNSNSEN